MEDSRVPAALLESMKPPVSRAKSCANCRSSKVKCRGPPGRPPFPCSRCVRLKLECVDPKQQQEKDLSSEDGPPCTSGPHVLSKLISKRLSSQPPINKERIRRLLGIFTLLYRRRVLSGVAPHDSPLGLHLKDMVRVLAQSMGYDADSYMCELTTTLDGPEGCVIEGHYLSHRGPRKDLGALHPYCAGLFHECRATIAIVNIGGEDRFYVNESFSRTFFSEAEAQNMYNVRMLPVPTILSIPICREEKSRFDRAVKRIMLEPRAACAETTQIYRVRLPKLRVVVMAVMRSRFMLVESGDYLCAVFSFSPLPIQAGASRRGPQGDKRSTLQCNADADQWYECAQGFGDWEEPRDNDSKDDGQGGSSSHHLHGEDEEGFHHLHLHHQQQEEDRSQLLDQGIMAVEDDVATTASSLPSSYYEGGGGGVATAPFLPSSSSSSSSTAYPYPPPPARYHMPPQAAAPEEGGRGGGPSNVMMPNGIEAVGRLYNPGTVTEGGGEGQEIGLEAEDIMVLSEILCEPYAQAQGYYQQQQQYQQYEQQPQQQSAVGQEQRPVFMSASPITTATGMVNRPSTFPPPAVYTSHMRI